MWRDVRGEVASGSSNAWRDRERRSRRRVRGAWHGDNGSADSKDRVCMRVMFSFGAAPSRRAVVLVLEIGIKRCPKFKRKGCNDNALSADSACCNSFMLPSNGSLSKLLSESNKNKSICRAFFSERFQSRLNLDSLLLHTSRKSPSSPEPATQKLFFDLVFPRQVIDQY